MNEKILFQQMEKITKLGVLITIVFLMLMGLILQEGLTNGFEEEDTSLFCATPDSKETVVLTKNSKSLNGDRQEGKALFLEKCASCHNIDMVSDMTGPALSGAVNRWKNRADLYQWVQDYSVLVEQGHPRALQMEKWSPAIMTAFQNLDTAQIRDIFAFVEGKNR